MRWARSARPMRKEGRRKKNRERGLLGYGPREMEKERKEMGWVHSGERNKKHKGK